MVFCPYPRRLESVNHLQMSLQRRHILLSYLKTLCVGPAGVLTCDLPQQTGTLPTKLTRQQLIINFKIEYTCNNYCIIFVRH